MKLSYKMQRMEILFLELLEWASMVINDDEEFIEFLKTHGFTDEEIKEYGIEVIE